MISDRSVKNAGATAGVVIEASQFTIRIGTAMPPDKAVSSFTNAKVFVLYAGLLSVLALSKSQHWHGAIEKGCACNAALIKLARPSRCDDTDCVLTTAIY
jgi:hypothetical protein